MKNLKLHLARISIILIIVTMTSCGNTEATKSEPQAPLQSSDQQQISEQQRLEQQRLDQQRIEQQQEEQRKREAEELAAKKETYRLNITSLLQGAKSFANLHSDYDERVAYLRNLDLSQLPSDFSVAYIDNIHAWEDAAKIKKSQAELKEYGGLAAAAGLVATMTNSEETPFSNYLDAQNKLQQLADDKNDEIHRTWQIVESVAVSYGATLPK